MRFVTEGNRLTKSVLLVFLLLGLAIALTIEFDHWKRGPLIREFNFFLYDIYIKNLDDVGVSDEVVIIDIDEKSLQQMGQWPWPRYRLANLLSAAAQMSPAAIGLDVFMPEPDRTAINSIRQGFKRDFGLDIEFTGVPSDLVDSDEYLGDILRQTPSVAAHYFLFDHTTEAESCRIKNVTFSGEKNHLNLFEAPGLLCNTEKLENGDRIGGFINTLSDEDGILRRLPMLIEHNEVIYPNLALATIMAAQNLEEIELVEASVGTVLKFGDNRVPIDRDGMMLLRYPGPAKMHKYVSALDVLKGRVKEEQFRDKLVFVGSSAAGLYDFHHTVYDPNYPGVETLAVAAGNILNSRFIRQPYWGKTLSLILSLTTALIMTFIFAYVSKPGPAVLGIGLLLTILLGGGITAFRMAEVFIPIAAPLLTGLLLFALFSALRYGIEQHSSFIWYQRMARSQQVTLESMATVVETRDYETGGHIKRTQHFAKMIAEQLVSKGVYTDILTPEYIQLLFISAPLHDIGKVGVPDNILLKPGPLNFTEFEEMKKHIDYGRHILINSGRRLEGDNFLELAREIAESHHEKWDGTGYPFGLAKEDIPLSGRIMMVADVYDALTSKRCYKPAYSHEKAMDILRDGRATFFDPYVLDAFIAKEQEVIAISASFKDSEG